jgi:lathosterol oxidase
MAQSLSWPLLTLLVALSQGFMIILSVAVTWLVVRVLLRGRLRDRRIQPGAPSNQVMVYECLHTAYSIVTGAALAGLTVYLFRRGTITLDTGPFSVIPSVIECALYLFGLDAYQYVVHRLMHTRFLFQHVHAVHHRSRTPSPLTAYSFHPVELSVLAAYFPAALSLHTFNIVSVAILGVIQFFMNTIPHCGYEFAPASWYQKPWSRWLLTPFFHDTHHQMSAYNFGAITTLWDRLFGTIQPGFDRRFADLQARSVRPRPGAE